MTVNRYHKDRLFCRIFGDPGQKENLLTLFNVLNGTTYENADDLEINTLEDTVFMGMKNDVSCIVEGCMTLFEQQSTINVNMPLRGLLYFGRLYNKYLKGISEVQYSSKIVKVPTPRYFVLYNGERKLPDIQKLKLSDAFMIPDDSGEFEWSATVININPGHNDGIVKACRMLNDYSLFIAKIRELRYDGYELEDAVNTAIDHCINNNILSEYLTKHRAEAKDMILTEYDDEKVKALIKRESFEEGLEKGRIIEVCNSIRDGDYNQKRGAEKLGITEEKLVEYLNSPEYK